MDTMEMIGAIIIALVLGGALAYIFWRERARAKKAMPAQESKEGSNNILQLQLQAYERLILLTERIALPNLISRVNQPGLTGKEMQLILIQNIRQEFDYNITQQIYVSQEAWEAVRNLKEQNIHIINQISSILPPDLSGPELNRQILEMIAQNPKVSLHTIVAEALSFEAKKLMK